MFKRLEWPCNDFYYGWLILYIVVEATDILTRDSKTNIIQTLIMYFDAASSLWIPIVSSEFADKTSFYCRADKWSNLCWYPW